MQPISRNRRVIRRNRSALARALRALFEAERARLVTQVADELGRRGWLGKAAGDTPTPADVQSILDALKFGGWASLTPEAERILLLISEDGAKVALAQIGVPLTPEITDQVNEAAVAFARARGAELVGMRWEGDILVPNPNAAWAITDSTREMLRGDITRAMQEGWSNDDLAAELADNYAFSDARAMMIARTETASADIQGNLAGYRESGVVEGKESILSDNHAVYDECDDAASMGVVPLDSDFGGLGDPPYHPNCACDVLPVLADREADG